MFDPTTLRRALGAHAPRLARGERQAAVAIVAREGGGNEELLFIRRAEHPLDPWSGHMAFPGGMVEPDDASPLAAALRETREELGLDLEAAATPLGRLSDVAPQSVRRSLSISPFVFALDADPGPLQPNDEVAEALWIPLARLADRSCRSTYLWSRGGTPVALPCYRHGERVIWGLTLRMVDELVELLEATAKAG